MRRIPILFLILALALPAFGQPSHDDPQGNRAWATLGLIYMEAGFGGLSLASQTEWGPDVNGWFSGVYGGIGLVVASSMLVFTDDPIEQKAKILPFLATALMFCGLSYYQFNIAKSQPPNTRPLNTFLGYQAALAPVAIQTLFFF